MRLRKTVSHFKKHTFIGCGSILMYPYETMIIFIGTKSKTDEERNQARTRWELYVECEPEIGRKHASNGRAHPGNGQRARPESDLGSAL